MMTRIASDCGRNIYFVSDNLKQIVTLNQDRIKVSDPPSPSGSLESRRCLVHQHGRSSARPNRFT